MFLNILVVCAVGLGQANQNNSNSTSGKNSNDEMHPEFKRTLMIAAIVMPVVLITFGCIGILWYSLVMLRYRSTDRYQRIGNGRPISHTLRLSGHPMRGTSKEKTVAMMKNTVKCSILQNLYLTLRTI
ncbi:hypothetical protein AAMO2058_001087500 [Amorphochlora amoebiformis]